MLYVKQSNSSDKLSIDPKVIDAMQQQLKVISETTFTGEYGSEWELTSEYQDIGNNRPAVDNEYYKTAPGSSKIEIKQPGYYIVNFNGSYRNKGNGGNVWVNLYRAGDPVRTHVQYIYDWGGSVCFTSYWWLSPTYPINVSVSASAENIYSGGNEALEVIRLH